MEIINAFTGVGVAGVSRTLHVAEAAVVAAAHPAFMPHAAWSAAIAPQRTRRTATATGASVDRGTT